MGYFSFILPSLFLASSKYSGNIHFEIIAHLISLIFAQWFASSPLRSLLARNASHLFSSNISWLLISSLIPSFLRNSFANMPTYILLALPFIRSFTPSAILRSSESPSVIQSLIHSRGLHSLLSSPMLSLYFVALHSLFLSLFDTFSLIIQHFGHLKDIWASNLDNSATYKAWP